MSEQRESDSFDHPLLSLQPEELLTPKELKVFNDKKVSNSFREALVSGYEKIGEKIVAFKDQDDPDISVEMIDSEVITTITSKSPFDSQSQTGSNKRLELTVIAESIESLADSSRNRIIITTTVSQGNPLEGSVDRIIYFELDQDNPDIIKTAGDIKNIHSESGIPTQLMLTDHYLKLAPRKIFPKFFAGKKIISTITDEAFDSEGKRTKWSSRRALELGYVPQGENATGNDYFMYEYE